VRKEIRSRLAENAQANLLLLGIDGGGIGARSHKRWKPEWYL
jgi:hypothetical protein